MSRKSIPPPEGLSLRSDAIWRTETRRRSRSLARRTLLEEALRSLDLAASVGERLAAEGLVIVSKTTGVAHANPLLRVQKEARAQFVRIAVALGMTVDPEPESPTWTPPPWRQIPKRESELAP